MSERAPSPGQPSEINPPAPNPPVDLGEVLGLYRPAPGDHPAAPPPNPNIDPSTQSPGPDSSSPEAPSAVDRESSTDPETFATDIEVLGIHYPVRRLIKMLGNQRLHGLENLTATWKNARDTPGWLRLKFRKSLAKGHLNRKQAKFDAVSHLSDKNLLKRHRLKKLKKAQARFDKANGAFTARVRRMKGRRESVRNNVEQRRTAYRKELRARREAALSRRALRRELRGQGAGRIETRTILKDIPKEHLARVGKLAANVYVSKQRTKQASRQERKAVNQVNRASEGVQENLRQQSAAAYEARRADESADALEATNLPQAQEALKKLEAQRTTSEDNTAVQQEANLERQIEAAKATVAATEREIIRLRQVAQNNRARVVALNNEHTALSANLDQYEKSRTDARAATETTYDTMVTHKDKLAKAAAEVTNGGPETTENN